MAKKAGGKKKKKSKEELEAERLAAEEEERKRLEEEELQRKEEERLRLEKEEFERQERERLRREELQRLNEEADQTRVLAQRRRRGRETFLKSMQKTKEWEDYLQCSHFPTFDSEADLQSYLQDFLQSEKVDSELVLKDCEELQHVVDSFSTCAVKLLAEGKYNEARACQQKLKVLMQTQIRRLDAATAWILENADQFVNPKLEVLLGLQNDVTKLGLWMNMAAKGFRMKIIDFPSINIIAEIPKTLALQNIAVRSIYCKTDTLTTPPAVTHSAAATEDSLSDYDVAKGGMVFIEALKLPPPSKSIKGWSMRPINSAVTGQVQRMNFNSNDPAGGATADVSTSQSAAVTLRFKIPRDIIVRDVKGAHCPLVLIDDIPTEEEEEKAVSDSLAASADAFKELVPIRVGAWDASTGRWTETGISDVSFEPHTRIVSLTTAKLSAIAVVQKKGVDLPIRFWMIKPILASEREDDVTSTSSTGPAVDGALLVLKCDNWVVKLEVYHDGTAILKEPMEPELDSVRDIRMSTHLVLAKLAQSGIDLVAPQTAGPTRVLGGTLVTKEEALEQNVYDEMSAALAASFTLTSSKWNPDLGSSRCCFSLYKAEKTADPADDILFMLAEERKAGSQSATSEIPELDQTSPRNQTESSGEQGTEESKEGQAEGESQHENPEEKLAGAAEDSAAPSETADATVEPQPVEEPPKTNRSEVSTPKKKTKGGKKGKGKGKDEPEEEKAQEVHVEEVIPEEEEAEEEAHPNIPRTVLFEVDSEVLDTKIKCAFIRGNDTHDTLDTTISKDQTTHVYLENCLQAAGIYEESSIHHMQDSPDATSLRESIVGVLRAIRPLSFHKPM